MERGGPHFGGAAVRISREVPVSAQSTVGRRQRDDRLQMAISHWGPRFTTNGVTAGDFDRITGQLGQWAGWCAAWSAAQPEPGLARLMNEARR
jgi:hypothetical protein